MTSMTPQQAAKMLTNKLVTIRVGPAKVEFAISKQLICTIPFFSKAFEGGFKESNGVMELVDEDEQVFSTFIVWLYSGKVSRANSQKDVDNLVKLYVFADLCCNTMLENRTIDAIAETFSRYDEPSITISMAKHVYETTPTNSLLRKWLIETLVYDLSRKYNYVGELPTKEALEFVYPLVIEFPEFYLDFFGMLRTNDLHRVVHGGRGDLDDLGCRFHIHGQGETCHRGEPALAAWKDPIPGEAVVFEDQE
ncbi:uncharacterized protein LY89DRAFT_728753 [Mollisia scopiformis]|uniref:BTB domain-containing protein n=1 Tax=Mollisia scopiformis TaxID=149040 RepID=A0A194XR21_MOLSC|nr:uncharacterized protein LY89DRAFT_728753 [Mollisia scopiformis]KUJ22633.1 hypothetical protein LY89DRAFT_728753 [Mollisia scopiformis]